MVSGLAMMNHQRMGQIATWFCVAMLIVLSLVPGSERPHTGLAGQWEHFMAYAGTGVMATLAYRRALWTVLGLGLLSSALEILQNLVPGRGPAIMDAVFGTVGGAAGAAIAVLMAMAIANSPGLRKRRAWRDR